MVFILHLLFQKEKLFPYKRIENGGGAFAPPPKLVSDYSESS